MKYVLSLALAGALILTALAVASPTSNLYKVSINDVESAHTLAAQLQRLEAAAILRVADGYLILSTAFDAESIKSAGLPLELVSERIRPEQLALYGGLDRDAQIPFEVVYRDDGLNLYRLPDNVAEEMIVNLQLNRLRPIDLPIRFSAPSTPAWHGTSMDQFSKLLDQINQDSLSYYNRKLEAFDGRVAGTANVYRARDSIKAWFEAFGYDSVYIDGFYADVSSPNSPCFNVVCVKPGTVYSDLQIVVGAHYDAVWGSPGADDNGSGSAGVIEMARVLANVDTDATFKFITFDAEEWGLYGSWHYAEEAYNRGDEIILMFNMDMIGYYLSFPWAYLYNAANNPYGSLWQSLATTYSLQGEIGGNSGSSDHYPFYQYGYDVVFLIEGWFNDYYHSYRDSTSYIDFSFMRAMVQTSLDLVYQVSNSNDFDGDGIANDIDNCITTYNPNQEDPDADSLGSVCDNCPDVYNPTQIDLDHNGVGDHCDGNLHIISRDLPDAYLDVPYSIELEAVGGIEPYNWTFMGGDLPYGCTFSGGETAVISGTPSYNATYYFTVGVTDQSTPAKSDIVSLHITTTDPPPPEYLCGDADGNDLISIGDAVFIINYIFGGGPAPDPPAAGDADCTGGVSIGDAVYLISYIFGGGPIPCLSCM